MEQKVVYRYSTAFKRQVVDELESGRFGSVNQAKEHYGIAGCGTINGWVRRLGRNDLCAKVVKVEKPDEKDQVRQLSKQVKELEQLLGRKEAEKALNDAFLEMACEELGVDVEEFKKKESGRVWIKPLRKRG
jgi:transposase-like protein